MEYIAGETSHLKASLESPREIMSLTYGQSSQQFCVSRAKEQPSIFSSFLTYIFTYLSLIKLSTSHPPSWQDCTDAGWF